MINAREKPPIPDCLPGFEKINRYWDRRHSVVAAKILPGEYYVTEKDELITTVLGSCISVCVYDPKLGMGGMNHFMLPVNKGAATELNSESFRYGDVAMEKLINELMRNGAERSRLVFKAFGGGQIIRKMTNIGDSNIAFLHKFLTLEGFKLRASDLGGPHPRKVNFYPASGKVMMKRLQHLHNDTIERRETQYERELCKEEQLSGDIDLFE